MTLTELKRAGENDAHLKPLWEELAKKAMDYCLYNNPLALRLRRGQALTQEEKSIRDSLRQKYNQALANLQAAGEKRGRAIPAATPNDICALFS